MSWLKQHGKSLSLALALLLALAWYSRPVDVYGLIPGVTQADVLSLYSRLLGPEHHSDGPSAIRELYPEDPEWDAALTALEALRFRRPPWNLLLQFLPQNGIRARVTQDGDQHVLFLLGQEDGNYVQVQFFIDSWSCSSPNSSRSLPLWVPDSRETGEALAEVLRPLMERD